MNQNNRAMQQMMQNQNQGEKLEHDEQEKNREIQIREDRTAVEDHITTYYTPKQTVQRYNRVVEQYKNLSKTVAAYQDAINDTLEAHPAEMDAIHILLSDEPQENTDEIDFRANMLSQESLQRYHNIQEMHDQISDIKEKAETSLQDAKDLYPAARKMADNHELEIETNIKELEEWSPEDDMDEE